MVKHGYLSYCSHPVCPFFSVLSQLDDLSGSFYNILFREGYYDQQSLNTHAVKVIVCLCIKCILYAVIQFTFSLSVDDSSTSSEEPYENVAEIDNSYFARSEQSVNSSSDSDYDDVGNW